MNNNWISPNIKKEIEAFEEQQLLRKQDLEEEKLLKQELRPNYVLIDAALWDTDIDMLLLDDTIEYRSLFRGSAGKELWSAAPYLVDISSHEELVQRIKEKDPIAQRVTWLSSTLDIDGLRKHLRRFLRMRKEDGSYIYFRFYDPFVLDCVFPHLTPEQSAAFFEKIDYMIADDARIAERRIYYLTLRKELQVKHQALDYVDNNR